MERKGRFTRGPVEICNLTDIFTASGATCRHGTKADDNDGWQIADCSCGATSVKGELYSLPLAEEESNASLIASAFNAATTCEDMGYDGEACVKALPELVKQLDAIDTFGGVDWSGVAAIIAKCRV